MRNSNAVITDLTKKKPELNLCVGNPIYPAIGNKYQVETDYMGTGSFPLIFRRTYNSSAQLGAGWRNFYERRVSFYTAVSPVNSSEKVYKASVVRPDGKQDTFTLTGSTWTADADINGRLTGSASTGWTYTASQGDEVESFNANGKLLSITNRAGFKQTLTYNESNQLSRVADGFGRQLNFTYDAAGRVATLTDPAGQVYNYEYDANNNLISVTYPDATPTDATDNPQRIYHYNESINTTGANLPNALTGITDENGARFATYKYDATGLAIGTEHADGVERVTVNYTTPPEVLTSSYIDPDTGIQYITNYYQPPTGTTVTDALGSMRSYNFQTVLGVVNSTGVSQPGGAGCGPAASSVSYDANGNIASRRDFNGIWTTYTYDLARNLETSRTEASRTVQARTLTTAWHPSFRLPTLITEPGKTTESTYDPLTGNLLSRTETDTATNETRTTTYTYTTAADNTLPNLLKTVNGPRTDVADLTTYGYAPNGDLQSVSNALGHTTQITQYDAHGRPLTLIDPNGLVSTLTYDPRSRLTSVTSGSEVTGYDYDGVGQLTQIHTPGG